MTRRLQGLLAGLCLLAPAALPYIRTQSSSGRFAVRPDFASVEFGVNAVPGLANADGDIIVTLDSDITGAVIGAMGSWNAVTTSAARFAPPETTLRVNNPSDGRNTIVIADSPAIRSVFGPALESLSSYTLMAISANGNILDSDILLNPTSRFSTTGAPNTLDLQSVLTKALGNALGATNSAVVGAALYFSTDPNSTLQQTLSPEDVMFVTAVYPATDLSAYGTITGTLTLNGAPLRNALVCAVDTTAGTAFSMATSYLDGSWSAVVPPGYYVVYAQPMTGPVYPEVLGLPSNQPVDTAFKPTFLGGNDNPLIVPVGAGGISKADFAALPPRAPDDPPQPALYNLSVLPVGSRTNITTLSLPGIFRPTETVSGRTVDLAVLGPGIDNSLSDSNILLLGPLSLQAGSVRPDTSGFPFVVNGISLPVMRFTVNIPAVDVASYATLVIVNNGNFTAYTGGLVLLPLQ